MLSPDEVNAYLAQVKTFYTNLEGYLQRRIEGLKADAIGKSRFVALWGSKLALANVYYELTKMERLNGPVTPFWYERYLPGWVESRLPTTWRKAPLTAKQKADILTEQMLRAKEFLERTDPATQNAAIFIPVDAHRALAKESADLMQECSSICRENEIAIENARQNKSWFNPHALRAVLLVAMRINAFGLSDVKTYEYLSKSNADNATCALTGLKKIQEEIGRIVNTASLPTTRATQDCYEWGIDGEQYTGYVPDAISVAFKDFCAHMNSGPSPSGNEILEITNLTYPTPQGLRRAR